MASALTMPAPGPKPLDALTNSMFARQDAGRRQGSKGARGGAGFRSRVPQLDVPAHVHRHRRRRPLRRQWRDGCLAFVLTDEYAKSFAKSGGIGIADQVYRTLIAQQEARQ